MRGSIHLRTSAPPDEWVRSSDGVFFCGRLRVVCDTVAIAIIHLEIAKVSVS